MIITPSPELKGCLIAFIEQEGLKTQQINIRAYGPYELAMGFDGLPWIKSEMTFGYGWTTHEAAISVLLKNRNAPHLPQCMGPERYTKFQAILEEFPGE